MVIALTFSMKTQVKRTLSPKFQPLKGKEMTLIPNPAPSRHIRLSTRVEEGEVALQKILNGQKASEGRNILWN